MVGVLWKLLKKSNSFACARGLTQEELGNAVGVQKAAINKYETGRVVNIKRTTLQKLADALGVTPAELLDDADDSSPASSDTTVAEIQPSDGWTESELREINEFKRFLLHKRVR